jgi:glycosyltransferase involved in cell wall biosynthesis
MNPVAVIITYNEEKIIAETLKAITKLVDKIIIVDSFSTDGTCEIGKEFGAEVVKRKFDDYSSQRNFALSLVSDDEWVLMLDADEILSTELVNEISALSVETSQVAYYMKRVDVFCGKKLKYASENLYFPRLFRSDKIVISRSINEQYEFIGSTGRLKGVLLHYSFNKGIQDWLHKHVRYAYMESNLLEAKNIKPSTLRQSIKIIVYKSRFKIFIMFMYYFFVKRGFLDGRRGLLYINLKLSYEKNINLFKWYKDLN